MTESLTKATGSVYALLYATTAQRAVYASSATVKQENFLDTVLASSWCIMVHSVCFPPPSEPLPAPTYFTANKTVDERSLARLLVKAMAGALQTPTPKAKKAMQRGNASRSSSEEIL